MFIQRYRYRLIFWAILLTIFTLPCKSTAQDGYQQEQDETIAYFDSLLETIRTSNYANLTPLTPRMIHYLSGVYLYCSIKNGACPLVLEALLEADVILARVKQSSECPNLTAFWREWMSNEFEKRLDYTQNTYLNRVLEFKARERPRYIKCRETVAYEIKSSDDNATFFAKRYRPESGNYKSIDKFSRFLKALKTQVQDVFSSSGAYGSKK